MDHYWTQIDMGLNYQPLTWLSGGLHLWQIYREGRTATRWSENTRPYGFVTGTLNAKVCTISERARLEARHADNVSPEWTWVYRNRVRVDATLPKKMAWFAPYVGIEPFLQFNEGLIENRLYAGSRFKPTKWFDVDAGFFHQSKWTGETKAQAHVFALNIGLKPTAPLLGAKSAAEAKKEGAK
jgi:hypothetical protein